MMASHITGRFGKSSDERRCLRRLNVQRPTFNVQRSTRGVRRPGIESRYERALRFFERWKLNVERWTLSPPQALPARIVHPQNSRSPVTKGIL